MTILELLTRATRTRIVAAGQLILDNRCVVLLGTGVVSSCGSLIGIRQLFFADVLLRLCVLLALGVLFESSLSNLLLYLRNLGTRQNLADAVVHLIDHIIPHLGRLEFENQERVFLLVAGILHGMLQLVELAQVLLP